MAIRVLDQTWHNSVMADQDQIPLHPLQAMPLPRRQGITDACLINKHPVFYQQKFLCWGYLPDHLVLEFLVKANEINPTYYWNDNQRLINVMACLIKNYPMKWH